MVPSDDHIFWLLRQDVDMELESINLKLKALNKKQKGEIPYWSKPKSLGETKTFIFVILLSVSFEYPHMLKLPQ